MNYSILSMKVVNDASTNNENVAEITIQYEDRYRFFHDLRLHADHYIREVESDQYEAYIMDGIVRYGIQDGQGNFWSSRSAVMNQCFGFKCLECIYTIQEKVDPGYYGYTRYAAAITCEKLEELLKETYGDRYHIEEIDSYGEKRFMIVE